MAVLFTGAAQIPDEDREGVYKHLARHYHQLSKTPPEYRERHELDALRPDQVRGLFVEGEPDILPELFPAEDVRSLADLQAAYELLGKVLASQNETTQQDAEAHANEPSEDHALLAQLQKLIDDLNTPEGNPNGSTTDSQRPAPAP
jgi:hypothetical protein